MSANFTKLDTVIFLLYNGSSSFKKASVATTQEKYMSKAKAIKYDDNGIEIPKRKRQPHSDSTKKLISEKRRARVVQPRNATQSTKRQSFYDELLLDYKKEIKKDPNLKKWLDDNKVGLGWDESAYVRIDKAKEQGIQTEFTMMYSGCYEERCGAILFDNNDDRTEYHNYGEDPYNMIEMLDEGKDIFGNKILKNDLLD